MFGTSIPDVASCEKSHIISFILAWFFLVQSSFSELCVERRSPDSFSPTAEYDVCRVQPSTRPQRRLMMQGLGLIGDASVLARYIFSARFQFYKLSLTPLGGSMDLNIVGSVAANDKRFSFCL